MSVNISAQGVVHKLDLELEAPSPLTEQDVAKPDRLTRLLLELMREVRRATRLWHPRRIDFEGKELLGDGTTKYRLEHRFKGAVRYWVVEWSGADAPNIRGHSTSDDNTLVITSTSAGTATIRVEEAG